MFYRLLGIIACLFPIVWGMLSIVSGAETSRFGPILGGGMFLFIGLVIAGVIIWDWLEQIMNQKKD